MNDAASTRRDLSHVSERPATDPVRAQHPAPPGASAQGAAQTRAADDASIRPFHIHVPEEALVDLRRRLTATRWPSRETVADQSQGMQLAKIEELVCYWGAEFDKAGKPGPESDLKKCFPCHQAIK